PQRHNPFVEILIPQKRQIRFALKSRAPVVERPGKQKSRRRAGPGAVWHDARSVFCAGKQGPISPNTEEEGDMQNAHQDACRAKRAGSDDPPNKMLLLEKIP